MLFYGICLFVSVKFPVFLFITIISPSFSIVIVFAFMAVSENLNSIWVILGWPFLMTLEIGSYFHCQGISDYIIDIVNVICRNFVFFLVPPKSWFSYFSEPLIGLDWKWKHFLTWGWQLFKSEFYSFDLSCKLPWACSVNVCFRSQPKLLSRDIPKSWEFAFFFLPILGFYSYFLETDCTGSVLFFFKPER